MPQKLAIILSRRELLTKFLPTLSPHTIRSSGKETYNTVTGSVTKQGSGYFVHSAVLATKPSDTFYFMTGTLFYLIDTSVQQQGYIRFAHHLVKHNRIENYRISFRIAERIFHHNFIYHAALTCPAIIIPHVRSRSEHPQPYFTGTIPPQYRTILYKYHFQTLASCGYSSANP